MMKVTVPNPEDLENPVDIVDEIVQGYYDVQQAFIERAMQLGYAGEFVLSTRPVWEAMKNLGLEPNSDAYPVYVSGIGVLCAVRDEIESLKEKELALGSGFESVISAAGSAVSVASSTGSLVEIVGDVIDAVVEAPFDLDRFERHAERFDKFDADLGKTYREMGEALYGTRSDPERAALFLMRQAFDHLFDHLSPDADVADWLRQSGLESDKISRRQRIEYAAEHHIRDEVRSNTLRKLSKHMNDVYESLQHAHKRGKLDRRKAQNALGEMQKMLEQWADALDL